MLILSAIYLIGFESSIIIYREIGSEIYIFNSEGQISPVFFVMILNNI